MTQPSLARHIGLFSLTVYGVGDILGAGIYGLIGKAAGELGNALWLGFLVSMSAAVLTGLSYASLGSRYPRAGGAAYVVEKAFSHSFLAYLVGLTVLASSLTSMATAARVFAGYLTAMIPALPMELVVGVFALVMASIVFRGIREAMWVNILCTSIEFFGLMTVLVVGFKYWGSVNYFDATTATNPAGGIEMSMILGCAVLTFYSFMGFEDILNVGEEVIEPKRTMPRALIMAVAISSLIYIGIGLTAVSVLPAETLAESKQPLVDVVAKAAPWFPLSIYSLIAMFAVANTALLNFITGSRLLFGMGQQGLVPRALARVHQKHRTPHIAVAVVLVILLGLALFGEVSILARATSVLLLSCFCVVNASLIALHKDNDEEAKGAFNIPRIIPALGIIVNLAMLLSANMTEWLIAAGILLGIAVLYLVLRPKGSGPTNFIASSTN
jgi:amino acid transporter